ncbi:hypothetical protein RUM43_008136 [Polyplax serrata]|uniref:Uncharacterized protein n=1 Tax=Polyplax serrata TaxID=468196 RepID=A0AAN8PNC5_POLSC
MGLGTEVVRRDRQRGRTVETREKLCTNRRMSMDTVHEGKGYVEEFSKFFSNSSRVSSYLNEMLHVSCRLPTASSFIFHLLVKESASLPEDRPHEKHSLKKTKRKKTKEEAEEDGRMRRGEFLPSFPVFSPHSHPPIPSFSRQGGFLFHPLRLDERVRARKEKEKERERERTRWREVDKKSDGVGDE